MLVEKYVFDIAIYSVPSEKFFSIRQKKLQEHFDFLNEASSDLPKMSPDSNDEFDRNMKNSFNRRYGGWQFTQVVGWIRLFPLRKQMRGEYWFVDANRIDVHMNKRNFEYCGKAFELTYFTGEETSIEIFCQIKRRLEELKNENPFKRRYVDMETFINIGAFVNWRGLIGLD